MAQNVPPRAQNSLKNTYLSMPSGLRTTLEKMIFFDPGTPVDPSLARTVRGRCCPPAPPSDHWYGGLGVSFSDFEAWKPQKLGDCGWIRFPRSSVWSHIAKDTARSWFRACCTQTAHIQAIVGHFWAVSRTYSGARGQQKVLCHGAIEAHVASKNHLPLFRRLEWVLEPLLAKNAYFGAENAQFWEGTS